MTKSELKTGMILTLRNGLEMVVFLSTASQYTTDEDVLVYYNLGASNWFPLDSLSEELNGIGFYTKNYDVMKVEIPFHPYNFQDLSYEKDKRKLIWERKEIKEVTMAEVEEKFGCKVKIINAE